MNVRFLENQAEPCASSALSSNLFRLRQTDVRPAGSTITPLRLVFLFFVVVFLAACSGGPPPPPPPQDPAQAKADAKAREEFARNLPKPPER